MDVCQSAWLDAEEHLDHSIDRGAEVVEGENPWEEVVTGQAHHDSKVLRGHALTGKDTLQGVDVDDLGVVFSDQEHPVDGCEHRQNN